MDAKSQSSLKIKEENFLEKTATGGDASTKYSTRIQSHMKPSEMFPNIDEKKLLRKLDWKLIPVVSTLYLLAFLDRGNVGNAKIEGLTEDIHLKGNEYNICLTIFFITYTIFEVPSNMMLKKLRPSIWLPFIMVVWGVVMTLMGLVQNYMGLFWARFALGIAEAGLFPGVAYYLTHWYCRHELNFRQSLFFSAASIAGAFSGLLAFGISKMDGVGGLEGWRWIFILEGLLTVVVAFGAFFVLYDFPDTATFLTEEERQFIIYRLQHDTNADSLDMANGDHSSSFFEPEVEEAQKKYFFQALKDWQIYSHILVYFGICVPLYATSLFLPTIIKNLGYTDTKAQLMSVPVYVTAAIFSVIQSLISDRSGKRSPFLLLNFATMAVGFAIAVACDPSSKPGAVYAGVYIGSVGIYQAFPTGVTWLANNLAGDYKRAVGMAMHIGIGNFGGAFSSNFYRSQDAPHYVLGHSLVLGFIGMGAIVTIFIMFAYSRINAKREEGIIEGKYKGYSAKDLAEMGDKNPYFKYRL
ncbi:Soa1 protein [Saccharomycopsis crataegensis]|uniref:Soa1 protein n=1 Tax=Saccharomycopsis crataegensis TaxID=43959 RepID=A0AAV5QU39_9ASCO|nr:Soa1 protein [Saccharomycopsis crataegensis]